MTYLDAGACSTPLGPTTRAPANVPCVGDDSPALRKTGVYVEERRGPPRLLRPSSSCVPRVEHPAGYHSLLAHSRRESLLPSLYHRQCSASGNLGSFGAAILRPARSYAYASPAVFPRPAQGWLPAWAGSPLAGQDLHLLDDKQSFMEASHPPLPFDQPSLVAPKSWLYKWRNRYQADDSTWAQERSRRPRSNPRQLSKQIEEAIVHLAQTLTPRGTGRVSPRDIGQALKQQAIEPLPSRRTIYRVLQRDDKKEVNRLPSRPS